MQEWIVVDQFGNLYAGPFLGPDGNYRVELKK